MDTIKSTKEPITLSEASQLLNVSPQAIRRFCDKGYITGIRRNSRYRRVLTPAQLDLLAILLDLRKYGFSKQEIKAYAKLARMGAGTEKDRTAILLTRKRQLWQEISLRQEAIDFIERQEELAETAEPGV